MLKKEIYETIDGKIFDDEQEAIIYEGVLHNIEIIKRIKNEMYNNDWFNEFSYIEDYEDTDIIFEFIVMIAEKRKALIQLLLDVEQAYFEEIYEKENKKQEE